jgi:hypothetical protein
MLMSIKLLSPGTDDVIWLSVDVPTLIVEGRMVDFRMHAFVLVLNTFLVASPPPSHRFESDHRDLWSLVVHLL